MTSDPANDDITRSEIRYRGLFENMISAAMVLSPHPDGFRIEEASIRNAANWTSSIDVRTSGCTR
jgi:hypothetical protein